MIKKLLYTFFFGYAAFKWRRLIRTLIVVATIVWLAAMSLNLFEYYSLDLILFTTGIVSYIAIGLISWLIKPFIVKENQP